MHSRQSRPKSILWFERLYGASILVSIVDIAMQWDDLTLEDEFGSETQMLFVVAVALVMIVTYAIVLTLWYFVAYRASKIAKWLLLVVSVVSLVLGLVGLAEYDGIPMAFFLVSQALTWIAIAFLFRKDARTWFGSKGIISMDDNAGLNDVFR